MTETKMIYSLQDKEIKKSELNEDVPTTSEEIKEESKKEAFVISLNSSNIWCIGLCFFIISIFI